LQIKRIHFPVKFDWEVKLSSLNQDDHLHQKDEDLIVERLFQATNVSYWTEISEGSVKLMHEKFFFVPDNFTA
jgi:hypothetical protein